MKKYFSIFALLCVVQTASAETFFNQLCEFNFNWKNHEAQAPRGEARVFYSDRAYIQAHLSSVLPILRSNPVGHLSTEQLATRTQLIEILDDYRIAGKFPMNYYRKERIPVFIDEHDTHCAVGYLIQQTGREDLARRIAAADNYAWVKDIVDEELPAWQHLSGFTVDELKLIQGAYDSYMPGAFTMPNRYEIPQKPEVMTVHFDADIYQVEVEKNDGTIWCKGEGLGGVLNGRWEQNYAVGVPWIVGFYQNGDRTGQWEEYYPGTNLLCRTENWRNDKLNGVRRRFDREGVIIEEILFKDGNAVTKTNYDRVELLKWVRKPLDSNLVWTEVYDFGGAMIASGHERVHNPGNLLWFQNIELTALNSASITSRDVSSGFNGGGDGNFIVGYQPQLFSSPPLVKYKKEGEWVYYKEYNATYAIQNRNELVQSMFEKHYEHFGDDLFASISRYDHFTLKSSYDSVLVVYNNDILQNFYGYSEKEYTHLQFRYHNSEDFQALSIYNEQIVNIYGLQYGRESRPQLKSIGRLTKSNLKIGLWKHYDEKDQLYKTENFIIPRKEDEHLLGAR